MQTRLTTLTWNIGGAKLLTAGADPDLMASYNRDGVEEIAKIIKASGADIVALQEVEQKDGYDQAAIIAKLAGYAYYFHDSTSDSHIDTDCKLGHAILSKYPITNHRFGLFHNPKITIKWEDGSKAQSFDKGFSTCTITVNNATLSVATLHLMPFSRFDVDLASDQGRKILDNISSSLTLQKGHVLAMGDFNIDSPTVEQFLPSLFKEYNLSKAIINQPTTPKDRSYDHVLFSGISLQSTRVDNNVLTDHYPVKCDFTISE